MTLENIHSDDGTHLDLFENAPDGYRLLQAKIKQSKMITVLNLPQINVWYESESGPKLVFVSTGPSTHFYCVRTLEKQRCGFIHCDVISWQGMLISLSLICHNDGSYCFATLSLYLSLKCDIYFTECFSAYGRPKLTQRK